MKNLLKNWIGVIIALVILVVSWGSIITYNKIVYNEGKCPSCKTEWHFVNASRSKDSNGSFHYYECESCHDTITLIKFL